MPGNQLIFTCNFYKEKLKNYKFLTGESETLIKIFDER